MVYKKYESVLDEAFMKQVNLNGINGSTSSINSPNENPAATKKVRTVKKFMLEFVLVI